MGYNPKEPFNYDDCGEKQSSRVNSFKLVNRATKEEHFVCPKCIKKYNMSKPH